MNQRPVTIRGGFTLTEILLAVSILVVLAGVTVMATQSIRRARALPDAAQRVATGIRMARAEASRTGKRLRLIADPETLQLQILIEADPLIKPNEFLPYAAAGWAEKLNDEHVTVRLLELTGDSALPVLENDPMYQDGEAMFGEITFFPDGSCDSARIVLTSLDEEDTRIATVAVDGLNGLVSVTIQQADELEEPLNEQAEPSTP